MHFLLYKIIQNYSLIFKINGKCLWDIILKVIQLGWFSTKLFRQLPDNMLFTVSNIEDTQCFMLDKTIRF